MTLDIIKLNQAIKDQVSKNKEKGGKRKEDFVSPQIRMTQVKWRAGGSVYRPISINDMHWFLCMENLG